MQKSRPVASQPSQINEFKEKFLQLQELEEVLEEMFEMDSYRTHKLPKRVQDKPKTLHHTDSPTIISDDHL